MRGGAMSDRKLFRIEDGRATELQGSAANLGQALQAPVERNMETLFGARVLASGYATGLRHGDRIDSLGLGRSGAPVVFQYKRAPDQNVIHQGLCYLDRLLDHRPAFEQLVWRQLGPQAAEAIDWHNPRLVCIAGDFTGGGTTDRAGGSRCLHGQPGPSQDLERSPQQLKDLLADLDACLLSLGDGVQQEPLELYFAYRRVKNVACVGVRP